MQCPNCFKDIRETAKVCGYCGHRLQISPATCPECGKERRERAKICGYCGHKFEVPSQEPAIASTPDPEPALVDQIKSTPQPESEETPTPAPEPKPIPSREHTEQPEPVTETMEVASPTLTPIIAENQITEASTKRRKLPGWVWVVIGLIVVGSVAAIVFLVPNKLPNQSLSTPVTEIFPDVKIVLREDFNNDSTDDFDNCSEIIISGQVTLIGNGEFLSSHLIYDPEIGIGEGTLALFMIDPEIEDEQ